MTTLSRERENVQEPLLRCAAAAGWTRLSRAEATAMREGDEGCGIFPQTLASQLAALNPFLSLPENAGKAEALSRSVGAIPGNISGNRKALAWLRGEMTSYDAAAKRERNVRAADFDNPDANIFHATEEWATAGGRADAMFLLNGIPVAMAEAKSPALRDPGAEALKQVRRYHAESPAMMATAQVFNLTWTLALHYGATWNLESKSVFEWREGGDFAAKAESFFNRERFLGMLRDSVLFYTRDGELRKSVLRPHQERAAAKVAQRAADPERRRGLVWHTQGSGKTFTMITAALRFCRESAARGGAGTALLVMDRNELQGQLRGWVERLAQGEFSPAPVHVAQSKRHLRRLLQNRTRGLIVTMIHKFEDADRDLDPGENIAVFLDEAHRSVEGDLGNYLTAALPNATLIGFTGTPVDQTSRGRGTFKIFGGGDAPGYLDKYSVAESVRDGTTVQVYWQLAENDLRVPREDLDREFLRLAEAEGVSDVEELNRVLDRAATLKNMMKNRERVGKIAEFAARHFEENVRPLGYKALMVGVDREACALYKEALDRRLPPDWTRAIYSAGQNDSALLKRHQVDESAEKALREGFLKPGEPPHIFAVTDKLLTGFDAPPLYCMYLDKPMRDHVLLQAISRVNRPFERDGREKPCGLVIDFVGMFGNLEKALAFDSREAVEAAVCADEMMEAFRKRMRDGARPYLELCGVGDAALERARERMTDKKEREKFYEFFRTLQNFYEILSPDKRLREFMDDYRKLSALYYVIVREFDGDRLPPHLLDFAEKTRRLVMRTVGGESPPAPAPPAVLSEAALAKLKSEEEPSPLRIHNLLRAVIAEARKSAADNPQLRRLGERAEELRERFESRQSATAVVLELARIGEEILRTKREMKKSGLSGPGYAVFRLLEDRKFPQSRNLARKIEALAAGRFPHYRENPEHRQKLRTEVYRMLMPVADDIGRAREAVGAVFEALEK